MTYIQTTTIDGKSTGRVIERTPDEMVCALAQVLFERQAGCAAELDCETDQAWNITAYIIRRTIDGKQVTNYIRVQR